MAVGLEAVLSHLRRERARRQSRASERVERLRSRLATAADLLRSRYGATDVVLFGSLADKAALEHGAGDVDLAVHGVEGSRYFEALADLMTLFGAPVDLVELDRAPESLRMRVREEGVSL